MMMLNNAYDIGKQTDNDISAKWDDTYIIQYV